MMTNKRLFMVKCSLIILLLYLFVYLLSSNSTSNMIRSLQQSGRNLAAMEPKLQQMEQQQQQSALPSMGSSSLLSQIDNDVPTSISKGTITEKQQSQLQQQSKSVTQVQQLSSTPRTLSVSEKVRNITNCVTRPLLNMAQQRGDYWVFYNYVLARRTFECDESVTYTTHADYSFLDNLVPLVEKWQGPISLALHAPGTDFKTTLDSIWYLRDCTSPLIKELVTFHVYFSTKHIPKEVPRQESLFTEPYNCSQPAPYFNVNTEQMYKSQKKLLYPVNVGRNVARESVQTHFVLASDIELYPSLNIIPQFLEMIAKNEGPLRSTKPKVFPLHLFEVSADQHVPETKTLLKEMLQNGTAIPFHKKVCPGCHNVPKSKEWQTAKETSGLNVFHIGKRIGNFVHWEPIFIGTNFDPLYDERLSWEGKSDKMTQGYALCVLDYEFLILDNAFLVHKPGIKVYKKDSKRSMLTAKTNQLIKKIIFPELKIIYGSRKGCAV
ncbi:hypothetical protein AMK59_4316 [Oryctes borbonicus]|uniref:Uncharacterized protein n=1 Tax=Oryctes borbonicus TaxID=1629725 RepID=A0A0T6B463_9SCAR|nr:hypothetical protein AMK59_4316 [Oryctes borbonicus]